MNMRQQEKLKISAKKLQNNPARICQGDIFENIDIIESYEVKKSSIVLERINFPYVICLNQECDLENDFDSQNENKDSHLLHLAIAPAFIFEQYLTGKHWGDIFFPNNPQKRTDTTIKKIMDNEIPRFHYLKFPDTDLPELIVDFKHFFTINRNTLYTQLDNRLCSLDVLFKEKVSQRFSYYISRIGLPEY